MAWEYSEKDYQDSKITIPAGRHRVRIASIMPKISKTGKYMYEMTFDVSGYSSRLFNYLVFMPDNPKMTNGNIGDIVHSFGVSGQIDPELVPVGWVGTVGACMVKLDEESRSKISYFVAKEKAADLPPWKEPEHKQECHGDPNPAPVPPAPPAFYPSVDDADLPF